MHDADNDGKPDEILILDNASGGDISQAVDVWRWNKAGLGHSSNGYSGPYDSVAITYDGKINASSITTGTLNADLIKAGVISDVNGNSTIDMATGIAKLYQLIAERDLTVKDANDITKAFISTASGDAVLRLYDSTGTDYIVRLEQNDNRGLLHLTGDESEIRLIDSNNDNIGMLYIKSSGDGRLFLKDSNGNITVDLDGGQGRVKATNAFDEVYSGSLSTVGASWTFMSDFAGLLVVGKVKSGGSEVTNIIPTKMITTTPTRFQLANETNWISFDVFVNANDLIEVQIAAKSSTGVIERVYGMF